MYWYNWFKFEMVNWLVFNFKIGWRFGGIIGKNEINIYLGCVLVS